MNDQHKRLCAEEDTLLTAKATDLKYRTAHLWRIIRIGKDKHSVLQALNDWIELKRVLGIFFQGGGG